MFLCRRLLDRRPIVVSVTGAAGQIGYSLLPMIAGGDMFGRRKVILRLLDLDLPKIQENLKGVKMELEDGYFPLLESVKLTTNADEAFEKSDVALLVGASPRGQNMERKDLLEKNVAIFSDTGRSLNRVASRECVVVTVGNPANTNCLVTSKFAPSLKKENFFAMTRLDHNRGLAKIAKRLQCSMEEVENFVIWGNHSATQYPDVRSARVNGKPVLEVDRNYFEGKFISEIQTRGAEIIKKRQASSAFSAARGLVTHVRDLYLGSPKIVSKAVISDGKDYGFGKDLCYSLPIRCLGNFQYEVVKNFEIDEFSKNLLQVTENELKEEFEIASSICKF